MQVPVVGSASRNRQWPRFCLHRPGESRPGEKGSKEVKTWVIFRGILLFLFREGQGVVAVQVGR